ncbi:MAG TPA: transketolase [Lachnospiraceae bacterium]|nr:transketolase [Lachnospiraceae bacterium]
MSELLLEGKIRADILKGALQAGKIGAHIASSLSIVEICVGIFENFNPNKDVFILSKSHGALGYYAAMHQFGIITDEQFESFEKDGGEFPGQPSRSLSNHIDYSGGSLGMGLPYASGRAWSSKEGKVFVILGDGELDEGSNWEAASIIARQNINNICAIVDCNGLQSDGSCKEIVNKDFNSLWNAHGWNVMECDGHNANEIREIIADYKWDKPLAVLAHTIKGKGVLFMENNNEWHHHELKQEQYILAMTEIEEKYGLC